MNPNVQDTTTIIFSRTNPLLGRVISVDGELMFEIPAGADANHSLRTFRFPFLEKYLQPLKESLARHLLLMDVLIPVCDAAGTEGDPDISAAQDFFDVVLLGTQEQAEKMVRESAWRPYILVGYHADPELLKRGKVFQALENATEQPDWKLAEEYIAQQNRERRGVTLAPIDVAVLKYTGHYLHAASLPGRHPEAVDPTLLSKVLEIIGFAEQASPGIELPSWSTRDYSPTQKAEWKVLQDAVERALKTEYFELSEDSIRSVATLMCSDAVARVRQ